VGRATAEVTGGAPAELSCGLTAILIDGKNGDFPLCSKRGRTASLPNEGRTDRH
jgi:hypothetical protein